MKAADELDELMAILADPVRRRTVDLLGEAPRSAGELATTFGLTAPAMSRHLRALRQRGIVESRFSNEDARVRVYRLRPGALAVLRDWVNSVDAHWEVQLKAFKKHAKRRAKRGKA